jgi:hypothetical protein
MTMKAKPTFPDRQIESLALRRRRRAIEAPQAMADYRRTQDAVRERMSALREERLAREAKENA